jgi:hypothetical protein
MHRWSALLYAIAATAWQPPLRTAKTHRAAKTTPRIVTVPWLPAAKPRPRREGTLAGSATKTANRIFLPTTIISALAYVSFAPMAHLTHNLLGRKTALLIGNSALAKTVPGVLGLLFSVVASNTFTALYEQQEAAHLAVYAEVSNARSLLEQIALVMGGPGEPRCRSALRAFRRYVRDLEQDVGDPGRGPARRLSMGAPVYASRDTFQDPLEELLYASSVGLPSTHVYECVKDARAARARRLGALQRKLPGLQFGLLYTLGGSILASFVLAAAGYAAGVSMAFEAHGFGLLTFALVACLRVLKDIWAPTSGAYSVSSVLATMTEGLEDELDALLAGAPAAEGEAALAYGVI